MVDLTARLGIVLIDRLGLKRDSVDGMGQVSVVVTW